MADALAGKVVVSVVNALKFGKSGAIAEQGDALPAQLLRPPHPGPRPRGEGRGGLQQPARPPASRPSTTWTPTCWCAARAARPARQVIELTKAIPGTRALDAGPLANALIIEG